MSVEPIASADHWGFDAATALSIRVVFESPWRMGTGRSDSGVVLDETWVDASGNVGITAKHLKGRLRAQAAWLCGLLGIPSCKGRLDGKEACGRGGAPVCVTCRVFGSARVEPGWELTRARLVLPGLTAEELAVVQAAQRRRSVHNSIDPWSGRVAEDLLFTTEVSRSGVELEAWADPCLPDPSLLDGAPDGPDPDEVALLVGAVGGLEVLGARGRRGWGRCRAWVAGEPWGLDHDGWISRLIEGAGR